MNLPTRVRYSLAVLCLGASAVLGNQAVNQYHIAKTVKPSEDLITKILEHMVQYQQTETINDYLLAQARMHARYMIHEQYVTQALFYGAIAVICGAAAYIATQKRRN